MKLGGLLAVSLALAGCALGGGPGNPNLVAPKLVVQPREDGNVTVFVHGAFRETLYDWISVAVDNVTVSNRTNVFSSEGTIERAGFFVETFAQASEQSYHGRARLDVNWTAERLLVAVVDEDNEWSEARAFAFPYEQVLDRPEGSP